METSEAQDGFGEVGHVRRGVAMSVEKMQAVLGRKAARMLGGGIGTGMATTSRFDWASRVEAINISRRWPRTLARIQRHAELLGWPRTARKKRCEHKKIAPFGKFQWEANGQGKKCECSG